MTQQKVVPGRSAAARALVRAAHHVDGVRSPRASTRALVTVWVLTRLGMLYLLVQDSIGVRNVNDEVEFLYPRWARQLADGSFPVDDVTWQYPPGAGLLFLSPEAVPFLDYFAAFLVLTLAADALVAWVLARPGRLPAGAWLWTAGLPLLLNVPHGRFDIQVTALAVLALLSSRRRPRLGGALAALGALVKVWPLLTLLGLERGRGSREAWRSAAVSAAALLAVLALAFRDSLGFLRQQGARGVQIESLGGTVLALLRAAGAPIVVESRYGALEFSGPQVAAVTQLSLLLTVAAFGWLLFWRGRASRWTEATPFDAALAAVLLFTVTSRVISPQYLVWLIGLAAVCLTSRHTTQRPVAWVLLAAAAVTALAFPTHYLEVMQGTALGNTLMVVRNGLLLTATLLSCHRLWQATAATPDPADSPSPAEAASSDGPAGPASTTGRVGADAR
ncbi:glycosyltransferase family 87 protein [Streptomyces roseicoloratus]|uniref:Glycosyltransferase family 87 protein n=1 Tax=Streptomyces roseicoloratus TaxID=2508722 RepID=A0ABY9S422_9ACTN|nr:glycosyltransferase family 87 protein [Streptomyces roseicoloratus]WMX48646.1 glycosyltransferase family 87 protein [Streptomyces roseicoloratus]